MLVYRLSSFFLRAIADPQVNTESSHTAHRTLFFLPGKPSYSLLEVSRMQISPAAGALPAWSDMWQTAHNATKTRRDCLCAVYTHLCEWRSNGTTTNKSPNREGKSGP